MSSKSNDGSFCAELRFLPASEGGRSTPPQSGFHPQLKLGELQTSCVVTSVDPDVHAFSFAKPHRVRLQLMFKKEAEEITGHSIAHWCAKGKLIELYEGSKKIAEGYVIEPIQ